MTPIDHYCNPWQPTDFIQPKDSPSSEVEFKIDMYAQISYAKEDEEDELEEEDYEPFNVVEGPTIFNSFRVKRDQLLVNESSVQTVSNMLSQIDIPEDVQPYMIERILECARSMATASYNKDRKILPMIVSLGVTKVVEDIISC